MDEGKKKEIADKFLKFIQDNSDLLVKINKKVEDELSGHITEWLESMNFQMLFACEQAKLFVGLSQEDISEFSKQLIIPICLNMLIESCFPDAIRATLKTYGPNEITLQEISTNPVNRILH